MGGRALRDQDFSVAVRVRFKVRVYCPVIGLGGLQMKRQDAG